MICAADALRVRLELRRKRRGLHHGAGGEHEAAALERILAARHLVELVDGRPDGDVDVLARFVERLAGERHPMLPADESADPAGGGVDCTKAFDVARAPDEPLGVGRNELPVVVEEGAVRADGD